MSFRPVKHRDYSSPKGVFGRLVDATGGAKRAADLLGMSETQVYARTDPSMGVQASYDEIRRLTLATRDGAGAVDLAALCGGLFIPHPPSGHEVAAMAARGSEAFGQFMARLLEALADNNISEIERQTLLRKVDDTMAHLAGARGVLAREEYPH